MAMSKIDPKVKEALAGMKHLVEANSYEQVQLWSSFHDRVSWKEFSMGHMIRVGKRDGSEVWMTLFIAELNGDKIGFWDATSALVDHKMIDRWFKKHAPKVPKTDSSNFHNVLANVPEKAPC